MPVEQMDRIRNASLTPEISKIKIGDRGGNNNAPRKTAPVITSPLKSKAGKAFSEEKPTMQAIDDYLKSQPLGPQKNAIPVMLMSDDIDEILFFYRAIFNSSNNAMCISAGGEPKAMRRYSDKHYKKQLPILDTPIEVDCDKGCPEWLENGEKGACGWHANMSLMINIPGQARFPSRTVFRTSGWQVMQYLVGSLNALKEQTGGVLAGIPLWLVMHEVEGYNAAEKRRRSYPVMSFEFWGNLQDLREAVIAENVSRVRMLQSSDSNRTVTMAPSMKTNTTRQLMTSGEIKGRSIEEMEIAADIEGEELFDLMAQAAGDTPVDSADAIRQAGDQKAEVAALRKLANDMSDTAYEALLDGVDGDVVQAIVKLKAMTGPKTTASLVAPSTASIGGSVNAAAPAVTTVKPSSSSVIADAVAAATAKIEAQKAAKAAAPATTTTVIDDEDDVMSMMAMAEASNEPSETGDGSPEPEPVAAVEAAPVAKEEAAPPPPPATQEDLEDDFMFPTT